MHSLLISALLSGAALSSLAHGRAVANPEKRGIIWEPAPSKDAGHHILTVESQALPTLPALVESAKTTSKTARARPKPTRSGAAPAAAGTADAAPEPYAPGSGTATLGAPGGSITWSAQKERRDEEPVAYEPSPTDSAGSITNEIDSDTALGNLTPLDGDSSESAGSAALQLSGSTVTFYPSEGESTTVSANEPESEPQVQYAQPVGSDGPDDTLQPVQPVQPKPTSKSPPMWPGFYKPKPKPKPNTDSSSNTNTNTNSGSSSGSSNVPTAEPGSFGVEIDTPTSAIAPINNPDGSNGGQQSLDLTSSTVIFYPSSGGSSSVTAGKPGSRSIFGKSKRAEPKYPKPVQSLGIGSSSVTFYPASGGAHSGSNSGRHGSKQPSKRDDIVNSPQPGTTESLSITSSSVSFYPASGGSSTYKHTPKPGTVAQPYRA